MSSTIKLPEMYVQKLDALIDAMQRATKKKRLSHAEAVCKLIDMQPAAAAPKVTKR